MDVKKRKTYIFVVLLAVVIWGYYNIFDSEEKTEVKVENRVEQANNSSDTALNIVEIDFSEYASKSWGTDPFFRRKVNAKIIDEVEQADLEWLLGGILYSDKSPAAVINKRIVHQGDMIDGARVVEINRKDVKMEKDGTNFILGIKKEKS